MDRLDSGSMARIEKHATIREAWMSHTMKHEQNNRNRTRKRIRFKNGRKNREVKKKVRDNESCSYYCQQESEIKIDNSDKARIVSQHFASHIQAAIPTIKNGCKISSFNKSNITCPTILMHKRLCFCVNGNCFFLVLSEALSKVRDKWIGVTFLVDCHFHFCY